MFRFRFLLVLMPLTSVFAQSKLIWTTLPTLPGGKGWAGMYAGVSHGTLFALGGANFPARLPWEGGQKKWYDGIYALDRGKAWRKLEQKLPESAGYGVTVSYQNRIILAGGSNETGHLSRVIGYEWNGTRLASHAYPALPHPLANMAGSLVGENVLVVAGGIQAPGGPALRKCYALDLANPAMGWVELPVWPGPERQFPVCGVYRGYFYLFSGETVGRTAAGEPFRHILQDAYRMRLTRNSAGWSATWETMAPMPRGAAAAGTVLPLLQGDRFLVWGGVDAVTAVYKNPATHPGISPQVLTYFPETDRWEFIGQQVGQPARVTLPVVFWNGLWVYVSGESRPGIRTPLVVGVK